MTDHTRFGTRMTMAIAMIALVAGACNSGTTPSASTGGAASAPAASVPAASQPASSEAASGAAGGGDLTGQTVSVIGTWGGDEEAAFKEMVAPWEAQTGAKVSYTGTRDLNTVLTTGVASGVLPDLAGLPGPGQMAQWADSLIDLSTVLDVPTYESETAPALVELGKVNGKTVGVFIKTAVKGLMWFDPKVVDFGATPPATWDDLQAALTANASKAKQAWCLGIESGAATGWPATDWIEDLVLRQAGPDVYNSWWQGKTKWTDPAIKTGVPDLRRRRQGRVRRQRRRDHHQLRGGRQPAVRDAAGLPAPPPGAASSPASATSRPRPPGPTTTSSRSPTSTRSSRARSRARATCSACSTTRRPPSR